MDIQVYEEIYESMKDYNLKVDTFDNVIVQYPRTDTSYPHTVFEETRNVPDERFNSCRDRISSLGYKVDIYAKDLGEYDKQTIARTIAKNINDFLTNYVGLKQVGFVPNNLVNDASQYRITMTYRCSFFENRRRIL